MIKNGLLDSANQLSSPHFNNRPDENDVSLLVIHNISLPPEQFDNDCVEQFFCGSLDHTVDPYFEHIKNLRVSAHLFIKRDGSLIQFVPFHKRAWHAGESNFRGRENCNDYSIGVELQGTDSLAYTDEQYQRLIEVTKILMAVYPGIKTDRIVGHCEIAPERKTDPGDSFEWSRYLDAIK